MVTPPRVGSLAPSVSVVIVNFKAYEELEACLGSLAAASPPDREVIVIDHSTSSADLERVRARYPSIRVSATTENPGFSAGVNRGVGLATAPYVLLLNPDTRVTPGAVEAMVGYLAAHSDTAVVGARVEDPRGTVQPSARRFPTMLTGLSGRTSLITRLWPGNPLSKRDRQADGSTVEPREVDWVAGSCMAANVQAFLEVGGMDERFFLYWEDADICKRLKARGWRTVYVPSAVVIHGIGRSRRHARALSVRAFHRSALLYFAKHRAGRFRFVSLPIAGTLLYARMAIKLAGQFVSRRDWSDR